MPTLLVSGAGLGDSTLYGTTLVTNVAQGALPLGWDSSTFWQPRVSPEALGRNVAFDFTITSVQFGGAVRLDFDSTRPVPPGGWADDTFGLTTVTNVAQGGTTAGWDSQQFGAAFVSFDLPGRQVSFNFTLAFTQSALNVGFYFGGQLLVTRVGGISESAFGLPSIVNTAFAIYPDGIPPLDPHRSVLLVGRGRSLDFNFVGTYVPESGGSLRFDFDPMQRPVFGRGFNSSVFGTTTVTNAAQGAIVDGIASLVFGRPLVSRPVRGRNVVFEFNELYTPITGINVAFAFGDAKEARPAGLDATLFGTAHVKNQPLILPVGHDSAVFGFPTFLQGALVGMGWDSQYWSPVHVGRRRYQFRAGGYDNLLMGAPVVTHWLQHLLAFGRNQLEMGRPEISRFHRSIQPISALPEAIGEPTVVCYRQELGVAPGFESLVFGLHKVELVSFTQETTPTTADHAEVGVPMIAFALRYVVMLDTEEMTQRGLPEVGHRVRHIYVPWSSFTQWGVPTFAPAQFISMPGSDHSGVGTPGIRLDNVHLFEGWDSLAFSVPVARLMKRYITADRWTWRDGYGTPLVYNKKQYILVDNKQYFDYVPYMSAYNDVRNRNRHLYVVPWTPPPVSITHRVILTGQQTLPEGEDETGFGTAMVAFRIRHLYPSWRFAGFVDPYHFVHNYAIRQYLVGFDSAKFGKHRVWFNAQTIAPRYIKQDGYGRPFVAPRVRTLVELNPPGPFKAGLPWVSLGTRTVTEKPWVVPYGFGTPILRTFKIIIKPFPIGYNDYGKPHVKNRTPQVYPTMVDQTVIPKPWVSYYVRRVYPQSFVTAKVPSPIVLFRDRKVFVPGINQTAIPMPTVRQEYAEQIYDQTIWQYWPEDYTAGEVGIPNLGGNPFPVGWHSLKFGPDIQVRFMGIRPRWDRPDSLFRFGTPTLNPVQYIYQTNQPGDEGAQTKWAKPQFSPLTVWAQLFPPEVALKNHPPPVFHEVDRYSNPPYNDLPPWFGTPTVFTPHTEYLRHYHDPQYGQDVGPWFGVETRLDLKNRKLLPLSIKPTLFGFPTLNGPRKLFIKTIRSMEFGMPDVRVPDFATQWLVTAGGIDSFGSSEHLVENFIREIFPDGFENTIYGDNTPMVYHKPRGPQPEGWDSSVFGDDTWLSHYIRYLDMEGFDSYTEGYTFGMFEERMRVTGGTGRPVVSGGDSLRMGFPTVHEARRPQRIAPYMIPPPQYCHPHSVDEG